jgi:hypothetical protein
MLKRRGGIKNQILTISYIVEGVAGKPLFILRNDRKCGYASNSPVFVSGGAGWSCLVMDDVRIFYKIQDIDAISGIGI